MSEEILADILEQLKNMTKDQQVMKSDVVNLQKDVLEIKRQSRELPAIKVTILKTKEIVKYVQST